MDWSSKHFLSLIFLILTHFIASVTSMYQCNNDNGNYTQGSTYDVNLNRALSSLPTDVNNTGFHYTSFGQNQDRADAFVMCRADVSLDACKNCTETAISETRGSCRNQKQAFNWQDNCMLKYANDSMYGKLETRYKLYMWNVNNASSPDQFNQDLRKLLDDLGNKASDGGDLMKAAVGNVTGSDFQTTFAMVQCKPDLSPEDCTTCLYDVANDVTVGCDGKRGCRILLESCFLRYESYLFYNETRIRELTMTMPSVPDTPTPQPQTMSPPPAAETTAAATGNKTHTIAVIAMLLLQLLLW